VAGNLQVFERRFLSKILLKPGPASFSHLLGLLPKVILARMDHWKVWLYPGKLLRLNLTRNDKKYAHLRVKFGY
jgi:hypothetical protein